MERKNKLVKKVSKELIVKINDVVTIRTLVDVIKDFLGDVNLEFKRDPDMELEEDEIPQDKNLNKNNKMKIIKEIENDIENNKLKSGLGVAIRIQGEKEYDDEKTRKEIEEEL